MSGVFDCLARSGFAFWASPICGADGAVIG